MNLYNLLSGGDVDYDNFYEKLFADYLTNVTPTILEYVGTVPYTFSANGEPLIDWYIKGNTTQSGTPSPSNPVDVNGVGERMANLFDAATAYGTMYNNGTVSGELSALAAVKNAFAADMIGQQVTISVKANTIKSNRAYIRCSIGGSNIDSNAITQGNTGTMTVTVTPTSISDKWWFTYGNGTGSNTFSDLMLNTGSTALPYEPYGYKIPILCGGTVNDVYIGANPLRKALDGTAVDELSSNGTLTQRVDADGSVLPVPVITQIDTPTIPTANGINTFDVETAVKPSEIYIKYYGG